jgi:hypothetical protein
MPLCFNFDFARRLPAALVLVALQSGAATAQALTLTCHEQKSDAAPNMIFSYNGGETGTLAVSAPFGEISLPATREEQEQVVDGHTTTVTGIQAFGYAEVLVPSRMALEGCIADGAKQEETAPEEDTLYLITLGCWEKLPTADKPTRVTTTVYISIDEPPAANVSVIHSYLEASEVVGKRISLDSFPSQCGVKQ